MQVKEQVREIRLSPELLVAYAIIMSGFDNGGYVLTDIINQYAMMMCS